MPGRLATLIVPDADMPVETAIHDAARKNGGDGYGDQMDVNRSHFLENVRALAPASEREEIES